MVGRFPGSGEGLSDLPMMAEWIEHSSDTPAVPIPNRPDEGGSGSNGIGDSDIWIVHDHHHPHRASGKCFRAEILVLGGFVGHPKFGSVNGKARDYGSIGGVDAV